MTVLPLLCGHKGSEAITPTRSETRGPSTPSTHRQLPSAPWQPCHSRTDVPGWDAPGARGRHRACHRPLAGRVPRAQLRHLPAPAPAAAITHSIVLSGAPANKAINYGLPLGRRWLERQSMRNPSLPALGERRQMP